MAMNFNKYQRLSNINFLVIFIIIGIILVLTALVIKDSDHRVVMAEENIQGYRISPPLFLGTINKVAESKIEWEADIPEGTSIIIETAVTGSDSEIPTSWNSATNGGPIPGIEKGASLNNKFLWTKQTLITNNSEITPKLKSLTETIKPELEVEGYRISPVFDFSDSAGEKVKDSRIFWQSEERFGGKIEVWVKVFCNGEWSDWQEVTNGGRIPGLKPGENLANVKIQTKTTFFGSPEFSPSLENIKIFIETEE
jgi:hypothetical protein